MAIGFAAILSLPAIAQQSQPAVTDPPIQVSGIYPHLALFNDTGPQQDNECGIGAIVPWAGKLWLITYPPHRRTGSADKLYSIDERMQMIVRPESVGGTHAGRMIHAESQQLIIGPYFVDAKGNVRAVDQTKNFPARITAVTRHLTDPANKVYMVDMEGPVWEVDVHTLEPKRLFVKPIPGWHAKGAYTSQGRLIVANNGERRTADLEGLKWELPESQWSKAPEDAGVLAEYDGKTWTIVSRRQYTDVSGPGGVMGERDGDTPAWSIGWDRRSVLLQVRSSEGWSLYRLPKGSYTYDPSHGWFTEWPRIRAIGEGPLLLNMHGTFFDFPATFSPGRAGGVRPLSTHLHFTTDFADWNGGVVLSGNDTSIQQNPLGTKPQSNLRFLTRPQVTTDFGPRSGWGGVWIDDAVKANQPSDPFLIAGYAERYVHLAHDAATAVTFSLEIDELGDGRWREWKTVSVPPNEASSFALPGDLASEWLRVKIDRDAVATAFLHLQSPIARDAKTIFSSLAPADAAGSWIGGLLRPANFSRDLQFLARSLDADGQPVETYYEINERLQFTRVDAPTKIADLRKAAEPAADYTIDDASVLIVDEDGGRWRLPKTATVVDRRGSRGIREVISERYLAHFDGTFYEIPRRGDKTAPDFRRMKAISSHQSRISDFATWRGMLVIAGTRPDATADGHYFRSADSSAGLWFGAIDDLYALGAPAGEGGPWKDASVTAGVPSDPYLMTNFGRKSVALSHDGSKPVRFTLEIDVTGTGKWIRHAVIDVAPAQPFEHAFPDGFAAHWIRVTTDYTGKATAWFRYR